MDDSSTRAVQPQNTCPNCGRLNRPDAVKCWWCGTPLVAVDPSQQPTLPFDVNSRQPAAQQPPAQQYAQPQYPANAPTQRVGPPPVQQQSYTYSDQAQYAQPAPAPPPYYASPAAQVNVNRRTPAWIWALVALLALVFLGALALALRGPEQPSVTGPLPTATPQGAVVPPTSTLTIAAPTLTPVPAATDTPAAPTATSTDTPVPPTDTPAPPPTDTPVPPPPPTDTPVPAPPTETPGPPLGDYAATAQADPPEPKTPNGGMRITGTLYRGGQPVQGAEMRVVLHYENRDDTINGPQTGPDGAARVSFKVGKATPDFQVNVDVQFLVDGQEVIAAQTSFTPRDK